MCHIAFGAGTEYCRRRRVRLAMARNAVPSGSTLLNESRTLGTMGGGDKKMLTMVDNHASFVWIFFGVLPLFDSVQHWFSNSEPMNTGGP